MQNAHLRLGRLEYIKPAVSSTSTSTHLTAAMDRLIVEPACSDRHAPRCYLFSAFGGEQEIATIHAAVVEQANFRVSGPELSETVASLGQRAHVFRGSVQVPVRRHPVRHLVAVSQELFDTQAGGNAQADRTIVYSTEPEFLVYRLGVRFGIPLLPCWSRWIAEELKRQNRIRELPGLGCYPAAVRATKHELLDLIAAAIKNGALSIPEKPLLDWNIPQRFPAAAAC
ncbi:MAG: hypothetical protein ACRD4O_11855 [Bryobacteraceae bacterium]